MITEYFRPKTIPDALKLLSRQQPLTYALGGGTYLNRGLDGEYAVVDLQDLGLGWLKVEGNQFQVGATSTLQELVENQGLLEDLYPVIKQQATYNLRQVATVAGTLVTATGRSPFATVLLALDATLELLWMDAKPKHTRLGEWLPLRKETKPAGLITHITFPAHVKMAYESIARSPDDQPICCGAVVQWNSGRTRLVMGGWGESPLLAFDGPEPEGIEIAAKNAYSQAEDQWASGEYRQEMAGILASRCMQRVSHAVKAS